VSADIGVDQEPWFPMPVRTSRVSVALPTQDRSPKRRVPLDPFLASLPDPKKMTEKVIFLAQAFAVFDYASVHYHHRLEDRRLVLQICFYGIRYSSHTQSFSIGSIICSFSHVFPDSAWTAVCVPDSI
jgi:hypothetical protein